MNVKKNLDHPLIGLGFAIAGTFLGLFLVQIYWTYYRGYPMETVWGFVMNSATRLQYITFSQVVNVGVFFLFFNTKRDRSANGVILFFILLAIPLGIQKLL